MRRLLALLACLVVVTGCGGDSAAKSPPTVVLSLDFVPNAVHAPIYMAVRNGHDREQGIKLDIRKPAGGPDALKLVAGGRVDVGVLDIHDLAIAREQGVDLVASGRWSAGPSRR
jgi:NitT/TauT family transport system substrate-binding protein/putative hydroxymethylpyrimidine transport system substrate-binding protein